MPCARKRVHERRAVLMDDIAYRMGYLCKRVLVFDLNAMRQADNRRKRKRSRSPEAARGPTVSRGKDAIYWSEVASSLSKEAAQLREEAKRRDRDSSSLRECNTRLLVSYREMERKLSEAERELTYLRTDPFQESRSYSSIISTIPLNTEGKDAFHWHQTCRTVQQQYIEAKREIDEKTSQFIMLSKRIKELEALLLQNKPSNTC